MHPASIFILRLMKLWVKKSERVYVLEVQLKKSLASRLFSVLGAAFEDANTQNVIHCSFHTDLQYSAYLEL
jgi:hypothetical protein